MVLSHVYLVRHGQAGSRAAYDALSETGRRQAALLGRWFAAEGIRFHRAFTGMLNRQRATADTVQSAYSDACDLTFPEPQPHPAWNEFDLDAVYASLAPVLRERDEAFRLEHDAMLAEIDAAKHQHSASIHRRWTACDVQIVRAWVSGDYPCTGESWLEFQNRVASGRSVWDHCAPDENVVIFTSATPIGIWCALAEGAAGLAQDTSSDRRAMRLAGTLLNASFTTIQSAADVRLLTFNNVPHLENPELRTQR